MMVHSCIKKRPIVSILITVCMREDGPGVDDEEQLVDRHFLRGIGRRVRLLRLSRELSQDQLATAAGMSRNFVSSIERGAHGVDVVRLHRLAGALDVDIAQIVSEDAWRGIPA
jgi:ribosome-binding protein aMBF1 (putative translation factor)